MTEVKFFRNEAGLRGFLVKDHTGYAPHGQDIVCAAISALAQTTLLGLKKIVGLEPEVELADGYLYCLIPDDLIPKREKQAQLILKVLYEGIIAISEEYSRYVSVKEVRCGENENGSSVVCHQKRRRKH